MSFISVLIAAAAAWIFGAVWYGTFGKRWMAAVGFTEETINRKDYVPYVVSFICLVLVAGMTRHIMATSGVHTGGAGLLTGLGLGLFIATPWTVTHLFYEGRDKALIWINGGYSTIGTTIIALVLTLF